MNVLSKWKLGLYVAVIFLAGGGSGALIAWKVCRRTPIPPMPTAEIGERLRARFESRLELSADQMEKVGPMIDQSMRRLEVIRRDTATQILSNVSTMHEQVVQVLTPDQRSKFEDLERERIDYLRKKYGAATNSL
jgi:hypothetical protein